MIVRKQNSSQPQPGWRYWREQDPEHASEAERYAHPIPSRGYLRRYFEAQASPMPQVRVAADFGLEGEAGQALTYRLEAMVRAGDLIRNRRDEYCLTQRLPVKVGTVLAHRDGYGFLSSDDAGEDIFLPPRSMRSLMHGDRAAVRVQKNPDGRFEGRLVEVLERSHRHVAGEFYREHGLCFVRPDDPHIGADILVPPECCGKAQPGEMITVELTAYPDRRGPAVGRVVEVLGPREKPGMAVELAIRNHDLPHVWPTEVIEQAAQIPEGVCESERRGRRDLCDFPFVTIDGEDARDFDDALCCRPEGEGFRLFVAIADVAHYVGPGSAIDAEAHRRGNSVYFPQRVLPMLPEVLSNGLCSLNPEVDRLCLVAELRIDPAGKVSRSRFYPAVIHSQARLTYTEVAAILVAGDKAARARRRSLLPHLEALHGVYRALAEARSRRGAIDFDSVETRFVFDTAGRVQALRPIVRNEAHRLVEESMIAANSAAARHLIRAGIPAIYRAHERPPSDRLAELRDFLAPHGLSLGGGDHPEPRHYSKLLKAVAVRPDRLRVETMLLRSLAQAVYQPKSIGHFGLALEHYTHFTSPIRRYPDLVVHRALKHLAEGHGAEGFAYGFERLEALGRHCSATERRADEATREAADTLKAEFMSERVGEEFDGVVTGVTGFGLFVQLEGLYLEGLVHVSTLASDYYVFDARVHRLRGEHSGASYGIGDPLRVVVTRVSINERKIDLAPAGESKRTAGSGGTGRGRRRGRRK